MRVPQRLRTRQRKALAALSVLFLGATGVVGATAALSPSATADAAHGDPMSWNATVSLIAAPGSTIKATGTVTVGRVVDEAWNAGDPVSYYIDANGVEHPALDAGHRSSVVPGEGVCTFRDEYTFKTDGSGDHGAYVDGITMALNDNKDALDYAGSSAVRALRPHIDGVTLTLDGNDVLGQADTGLGLTDIDQNYDHVRDDDGTDVDTFVTRVAVSDDNGNVTGYENAPGYYSYEGASIQFGDASANAQSLTSPLWIRHSSTFVLGMTYTAPCSVSGTRVGINMLRPAEDASVTTTSTLNVAAKAAEFKVAKVALDGRDVTGTYQAGIGYKISDGVTLAGEGETKAFKVVVTYTVDPSEITAAGWAALDTACTVDGAQDATLHGLANVVSTTGDTDGAANNEACTTVTGTPGIKIVKYINGGDADTAPGVEVAVGSTMNITYVVTNTGNQPLSGVTVTDDKVAEADIKAATGFDGNLAVGASTTFTATYAAPAAGMQHTNVGTAHGTPPSTPLEPEPAGGH